MAGPAPRPPSGAGEAAARSRPQAGAPPPAGGSHRGLRNGLVGGLIGGLVAGLIGGVAAWLALTYLVRPEGGTQLQALQSQVEQLDSSVQKLQGNGQALAQLGSRVQSLEQASGTSPEQSQAGQALAALEKRLGALEHSVSGGQGEATARNVADLRTHIATLENQLAGLATDLAGAGDAQGGRRRDSRGSAVPPDRAREPPFRSWRGRRPGQAARRACRAGRCSGARRLEARAAGG